MLFICYTKLLNANLHIVKPLSVGGLHCHLSYLQLQLLHDQYIQIKKIKALRF